MGPSLIQSNRQDLPAKLSGALGVVIVPDQAAIERAYQLAAEVLPADSEYFLRQGLLPHLTLYHGKLQDVPTDEAVSIVHSLRQQLVGHAFTLSKIVGFGGNFVFWNVSQDSPGWMALASAHEQALSFAQYLDRSALPKATSEEGLTLSDAELENLRLFGHPLVRQLYTPHITLGFHRGIAQSIPADAMREAQFTAAAVELVYIGYPGRVERVVDLENVA